MNEVMQFPVMVYQPNCEEHRRVTWYGGESTYLHYEKRTASSEWREASVQSLCMNFPTGVKELYQAMCEFYNECMVKELSGAGL